jgi:hypothetical protein
MKLLVRAFALLFFYVSSSYGAASDYDGTWNGKWSCGPSSSNKEASGSAFTRADNYNISDGKISAEFSTGKQSQFRFVWTGLISGKSASLRADGSREGAKPWHYQFKAVSLSDQEITFQGEMFNASGNKSRDCTMVFTLVKPSEGNKLSRASQRSLENQSKLAQEKAISDRALAEAAAAKSEANRARQDAEAAKVAAARAETARAQAASQAAQEKAKADIAKAQAAAAVAQAKAAQSQTRTTPPPEVSPAKSNTPARSAAIGNVVTNGNKSEFNKVTGNPVDKASKLSSNDVWISFNPSITVQERQFCRIVENFRTEKAAAESTKNQIKVNESYKNLVQSLNALLPDGKFQGWVMRTISVGQASDGTADVLMELPCNVYVGSNACDSNPKNFYGTVPEGSRIYTELAKMTVGDFALVSGNFIYADKSVFNVGRSVTSFRQISTGQHCKAKSIKTSAEFFGTKIDVVSTIK